MNADLEVGELIPDFPQFVSRSFDLEPALYRAALSDRDDLLPTSGTMDELLRMDILPPDSVRLTRAGKSLPRHAYTRLTGDPVKTSMVDRSKVLQLFRSGATLTVNDVEQVWPAAQLMLRPLGRALACRTESVVFATPAGQSGFAPHADPISVVVVHGEGTKDWRVWPTAIDGPRTEVMFKEADLGDPLLEVTLEPGDLLYLPHGTPHAAAATHEQSVHISLGLRPRSWNDIVGRIVAGSLSPAHSTGFPALTAANVPHLARLLSGHLKELRAALEALDPEAALLTLRDELIEELRVETTPGLREIRKLDSCTTDQLFRVSGSGVTVLDQGGARCRVRVNGITLTLPRVIVDTLTARQYAGRAITCRQIYPDVPVGRALSVAKQLVRVGALSIVAQGSNRIG
jgi:hypothetical protein